MTIHYPFKKEFICDGPNNLTKCSVCKKKENCFLLKEQLEFYEVLKIKEVKDKFSNITQVSQKPYFIEIKNDKKRIDKSWNYQGENTKSYTHCFHNYPAMMIPQVAGRLIDMFAKKGDIVLDPFCGSGSVLVESKLRGLKSYGIDINPLAQLITKVKTIPIKTNILKNEFEKIVEKCREEESKKISEPNFFNIDFWFKPKVIHNLAILRMQIEKIKNNDVKDFFRVVFSETVRDVSNTRNSEFKLYRISKEKMEEYNPNIFSVFVKKVERNISGMESFLQKCKNLKSSVMILNEDTRNKTSIPKGTVNLVVTSPPYGDSKTTVAYGQFSRLSLQWLGLDGDGSNIDKISLGGQRYLSLNYLSVNSKILKDIILKIAINDKKRAREVLFYFLDLRDCLIEINRVLANKAYMCMVLGNRTVTGIQIPTDEIVKEIGQNFGWRYLETIIREIPSKRIPLKSSPSNIKGQTVNTMTNEYIVIFQKKGLN